MKTEVRASTPDEGPAITALLRASGLKLTGIALTQQQLHWKYWQERSDWPGPRSIVVARGSELLAHTGILPGRCSWDGQSCTVIHMLDWAAAPSAVGAGLVLMKYVAGKVDALIGVGGSQYTLRAMPMVGFHPRGQALGFARPLRALEYLQDSAPRSWKTLPKLARNTYWALRAPRHSTQQWQVQGVDVDNVSQVLTRLPAASRSLAVLERSAGFFQYFLDCPIARMSMFSLQKAAAVRGYFMLAEVPGQVRLVDCWLDSEDPADWCALVQCAVDQTRRIPGIAELVAVSSDPNLSQALAASGFHVRWTTEVQMFPRKGASSPSIPLRFQMLDSDAAYNHPGIAQLWA